MAEPVHVALCVPVRDVVKAGFAFDLAHLTAYWASVHTPKNHVLYTDYVEGTLICNQRQQMVDRALKEKVSHILFLDSDMRFPYDIIDRLAAHDKDVVCVNYSTRRDEIVPICIKMENDKPVHAYTTADDFGIEKVISAGMGGMLIKREVFEKIDYPAFMIPWVDADHTYVGEDIYFCRLLAKHGIDLWVDHAASRLCRHVGSIDYSVAHAVQMRRIMDEAKENG